MSGEVYGIWKKNNGARCHLGVSCFDCKILACLQGELWRPAAVDCPSAETNPSPRERKIASSQPGKPCINMRVKNDLYEVALLFCILVTSHTDY